MNLLLGPQPEHEEKLDEAKRAWLDFVQWIADRIPISLSEEVEFETINQWCGGIACSYRKDTRALIVLSERFFQRTLSEQRQTLLHETLHVKFLSSDYMSHRVEWSDNFARQNREPASAAELQRQVLALSLWHVPDEALVERAVQADFPQHATERAAGYVRLSVGNDPVEMIGKTVASLRLHAVLWEWLRAELGLSLGLNEDDWSLCMRLRDELDALGNEWVSSWSTLKTRGRPLLDVSVEPLQINDSLSEELRDEVLAIPVD